MYKIQIFNNIAPEGLNLFSKTHYQVASDLKKPDAILLRSQQLHDMTFDSNILAIARAGAGVNNIPTPLLTAKGIPVFNTPGANANAVKELVIAGMLMSCRNICQSVSFTQNLSGDNQDLSILVEQAKKQFVGFELPGKTIAVIGLGAIGVLVANSAKALGMTVIGYDPNISIKSAWQLDSAVKQAEHLTQAIQYADFVTLHIPYNEETHHMINRSLINKMQPKSVLLNFARGKIVEETAVVQALNQNHLFNYVCDFPSQTLLKQPKVIALPHLGASTIEAEKNCAVMAATTLMDYLENGHISNSINFPNVCMSKAGGFRITIINENIPNMVGQISTELGHAGLNIVDMINKSRGEIAYTLVDVDAPIPDTALKRIEAITGVLHVRVLTSEN